MEREFGGKAHNEDQLADLLLAFPLKWAAARIRTADAIVEHLKMNPANGFHTGHSYFSMNTVFREAFHRNGVAAGMSMW